MKCPMCQKHFDYHDKIVELKIATILPETIEYEDAEPIMVHWQCIAELWKEWTGCNKPVYAG